MVLAPVELADVETVGAGVAVVGQIRSRSQVEVPVQVVRNRLGGPETLRPGDRASVPVSIDLFEPAEAAAEDIFGGAAENAGVLTALLSAGLVDPPVAADGLQDGPALPNGDRRRLF